MQKIWVLETWCEYVNEPCSTIESIHTTEESAVAALRVWFADSKSGYEDRDFDEDFDAAFAELQADLSTPVLFPNEVYAWISERDRLTPAEAADTVIAKRKLTGGEGA
jgi:hypothetical protein